MTTSPTPTLSVVTATETLPPYTSTYWTTYLALSPGPTSSEWTTSQLVTTSFPGSTRTLVLSVPVVTPIPPDTTSKDSSTFTTSITTSLSAGTLSSSASSSTFLAIATGITVIRKSSSPKIAPIVAGILVPVGLVAVALAIYFWRKRRCGGSKNVATGLTIKRWLKKSESSDLRQKSIPGQHRLPHELPEGNGCFRVASPPRPQRPNSISESVLHVMQSRAPGPGSITAEATSEHGSTPMDSAHLGSLSPLNDAEVDTVILNTDSTPGYDGTRKRYLATAMERGISLEQLSRPSLRLADPPRRTDASRRSCLTPSTSYQPDALRIHKKSTSDGAGNNAGFRNRYDFDDSGSNYTNSRYITNLEELDRASPALTEQEFVSNVKRGLSKGPQVQKAGTDYDELMDDASTARGSFANEYEIAQQREDSLAALEGRTPEILSSQWGIRPATGGSDAFPGKIPPIPPRAPGRIPAERKTERRKAIDEDVVQTRL